MPNSCTALALRAHCAKCAPIVVAGTCSLLDWMYVTAMPVIATSAMAENHIETNNIGLQAECCYEQEDQPPFPSTIGTQLHHGTFLTTKSAVRKNQENGSQLGLSCLDKRALAQERGGGVLVCVSICTYKHTYIHTHTQTHMAYLKPFTHQGVGVPGALWEGSRDHPPTGGGGGGGNSMRGEILIYKFWRDKIRATS